MNFFRSVILHKVKERENMTKTLMHKIKLGTLSLSAVALLAACGDDTTTDEPITDDPAVEEPTDETPTEDTTADDTADVEDPGNVGPGGSVDTSQGISNVEFPVTMEQAVQIFYDTFGENINIDQIELDEDIRGYEYAISGWDDANEYDIDIDAHSGEIRDQETDADNDNDDDIINLENVMTPQEAMDIATADAGVDFVKEWTLEVDDGITVYEIDLEGADDVTINAETGDIVDR